MAAKTYKNALDSVMTKLRESAVTALTDDYVLLVGEWMNTIKEAIEESWDWRAGRQEISFTTTAGQRDYDLSDTVDGTGDADSGSNVTNRRSRLLHEVVPGVGKMPMAFDVTDASSDEGFRLVQMADKARRSADIMRAGQSTAKPMLFSITRNTDGLQLSFREDPESARNYTIVCYVPDDELDDLADTIHIPYRALVLGTLWLAAMERGEELGINADALQFMYQDRLAKEIAMDMEESDIIMVPV